MSKNKLSKSVKSLNNEQVGVPSREDDTINTVLDKLVQASRAQAPETIVGTGKAGDFQSTKKEKNFLDETLINIESQKEVQRSAAAKNGPVATLRTRKLEKGLECLYPFIEADCSENLIQRLKTIASTALVTGDKKPIPATVGLDSLCPVRLSGPAPESFSVSFQNKSYTVASPIIVKKLSKTRYEAWVEFETIAADLKSFEAKTDDSSMLKKQTEFGFSKSLISAGIHWYEQSPPNGSGGIPVISADTARNLLFKSLGYRKLPQDFFDKAPYSWLSHNGTFNQEFTDFVKGGLLGIDKFTRAVKLSLARLLTTPIGEIEKKLFSIAFFSLVGTEQETSRGRGRPRKYINQKDLVMHKSEKSNDKDISDQEEQIRHKKGA